MRTLVACLAASTLALGVAACGSDKESAKDKQQSYVKSYKPLNEKLLVLGEDLSKAINSASKTSDADLATKFDGFESRFSKLRKDITALDPPQKYKADSAALNTSLGRIGQDMGAIADAARGHDKTAARQGGMRMALDAKSVDAAQDKLAAATGASKGDR